MENASKALIIAGSILISILLIAVGMYIYNASQEQIDGVGSTMSQHAIDEYNRKIDMYIGNNKTASDVKGLIREIVNNNNNNVGEPGKFIAIESNITSQVTNPTLTNSSATTSTIEHAHTDTSIFEPIGAAGETNNTDANVSATATAMTKLISYVNNGKKYDIVATYSAGLIVAVSIYMH